MVPYWPQIHILIAPRWFFLELPNKAMSLLNVSTSMHNPAAALLSKSVAFGMHTH
jgi:hypothetical protein